MNPTINPQLNPIHGTNISWGLMKPSHGPAFKVKSLNGNMCHYMHMHKILKKTSHGPNKNNSANIMPSRENAQNACHCTKSTQFGSVRWNFFLKNTIASNEVEGKCQSQGSPACWDPSGRVHCTMYILVQIESKKETAIYLSLKKCTNYTVILILYSTRICTPCRQYV